MYILYMYILYMYILYMYILHIDIYTLYIYIHIYYIYYIYIYTLYIYILFLAPAWLIRRTQAGDKRTLGAGKCVQLTTPPPGPVRRARNTKKDTARHALQNSHNIRLAQACIPNRSQLTRAQGSPSSQDGTQTSRTVKSVPLSSDEGRATQLHIYAPAH